MNDPWDVKSVRQSGQYVSCMKINGVPLLPPVLSKECRNEMQYYKLLAKEVEKRISLLKSYVTESDTDSSEDKTDAPEIPEYEQSYELPPEDIQAGFNINIDKITAITNEKPIDKSPAHSPDFHPSSDTYNSITSNILIETIPTKSSPKLVIDLSLSINETGKNVLESVKKTPPIDLPEHDYPKKLRDIELLTDIDTVEKDKGKSIVKDIVNFSFDVEKNTLGKSDPIPDLPLSQDGPSSLSSKSFTGSLIDIHTESVKEAQKMPKLIRQRSYTVLQPSPQLLAHLEVQSLNTGVDMTSISMSDSISNLSLQNKKRRSWDLESAKVKWSSMALELQKSVPNNVKCKNSSVKSTVKKAEPSPPRRARSVVQDKLRHSTATPKILPKTEPIQKPKKSLSPLRNISSSRTIVKEPASPITNGPNKESSSLKHTPQLISESEDPATRVKELYERIQKQQLIQMANLVEKQKREQILLQQVFDEQNNLLYKQLKTICPKSSIEAKEAWGEVQSNHGPVSLSQLINHKSPEQSSYDSTISATLTETNSCLNQSENLLKKSRDITGSIKKQQSKSQSLNSNRNQSRPPSTNCKIPSANNRSTSRRLNYDTSASTDKDYEPLLTDRTNDTMADLNVTFPSDHSNECQPFNHTLSNPVTNCGDLALVHGCPTNLVSQCVLTDKSMKNMEKCVQKPVTNNACAKTSAFHRPPTVQELAAATKIVAYAKGYLVRRLMRTERVQATVQTIKDALLCALQLHQDREGIRGADVDLHRRLIQQITAACYSLHDTFVTSSPAERCALIAADRDRGRRRSLATRPPPLRHHSQSDVMSKSHTGAFPSRGPRAPSSSPMTQSNYGNTNTLHRECCQLTKVLS